MLRPLVFQSFLESPALPGGVLYCPGTLYVCGIRWTNMIGILAQINLDTLLDLLRYIT